MSFLASSVDPNKIALTVKGLAVFVPTVIVFCKYFGVDVGPDELNSLIDALADLVVLIGTVISAIAVVLGLVRKIYVKFFPES